MLYSLDIDHVVKYLKECRTLVWYEESFGETDNGQNISQTDKHMLWQLTHHLAEII
jgi:hypothetical protein